jgi:hypothetical protein
VRTTTIFRRDDGGPQLTSATLQRPGPAPGTGTLLDEDLARELAARVEFGATLHRAAISLGLHPKTAERWRRLAKHGIVPYAELMQAVLDAQEKWKSDGRIAGEVPAGPAEEPAGLVRPEPDVEVTTSCQRSPG